LNVKNLLEGRKQKIKVDSEESLEYQSDDCYVGLNMNSTSMSKKKKKFNSNRCEVK
jgi:hypothetical protein